MKAKSKWKVFLDANVVIEAGKPPGGPLLHRILDLVTAELVSVLTTDLTIAEVARKHADNEFQIIKDIGRPHFRELVKEHVGIKLPAVDKAALKDEILGKYLTSVSDMFGSLEAKILAVDDIKPSVVFGAYANKKGFFTGDGKKDQFPDAFIFECLKNEASKSCPVIVVSKDDDFVAPVEDAADITLVDSIPGLFKALGLQVDAPELDDFLKDQEEQLFAITARELNDWQLQATDVDDAEIEVANVVNVSFPELVSFGSVEDGGSILVVGKIEIVANVAYTHPNWEEATYDSEDKVLIPFEDVSGEKEITFDADFSMTVAVDSKDGPAKVEDFRFRNSDFVYIDLY